jgi:hypothetical protein
MSIFAAPACREPACTSAGTPETEARIQISVTTAIELIRFREKKHARFMTNLHKACCFNNTSWQKLFILFRMID